MFAVRDSLGRTPRALATLSLVASIVLVAWGCGEDTPEPALSSTPISNIDQFDALDYYDLLNGDVQVEGGLEVTRESWIALVEVQRDKGFESLSQAERRTLLAGGLKAFLTFVSNTELQVSTPQATAHVLEAYGKDEDGYYADLIAYQTESEHLDVEWGGIVLEASEPVERREFLTHTGGRVSEEDQWTKIGQAWKCARTDDTDGYAFAKAFYLVQFATVARKGNVASETQIGGRTVTQIDYDASTPLESAFVDNISLFPVRLAIRDRDGAEPLLAHTIEILGLNVSAQITKPRESCV